MRLNKDMSNYSRVIIRLFVNTLKDGKPQNARIYAYKNDANNVDVLSYIDYTIASTKWVDLDVTQLALGMKGYGWMKFRIGSPSGRFEVSEGYFVLN